MTVVDLSYGWHECTGAKLRGIGATGAIGYAGCRTAGKNVSKARMRDWLNSGLMVGLVIENSAKDLGGGGKVGAYQGQQILKAAKALGYGWRNSVLFTGYDTNAHSGDYASILYAMEAFAHYVPVPGYYGDSDSIDYLHARHPDWIYWQSASKSFGPKFPTANAHLHQLVGGSHGLPIDVNNVLKTPLRLMGEDTMTPRDVWSFTATLWNKSRPSAWSVLSNVHETAHGNAALIAANGKLAADVDKRMAALQAAHETDTAALAKAIADLTAEVKALATAGPGVSIPAQDVTVHIEEKK